VSSDKEPLVCAPAPSSTIGYIPCYAILAARYTITKATFVPFKDTSDYSITKPVRASNINFDISLSP
jgi:hypothetical protein